MVTASPGVAKAFVPIFFLGSGVSMKQCYTNVREWKVTRSCQQTVQQLLDAVEDGTLEKQDADVLERGDFCKLLRIGRQ